MIRDEPTRERQVRRFGVTPPVPIAAYRYAKNVAISPDGRYIAFTEHGEKAPLWIHDLVLDRSRPIEGTESALGPFWSPDSLFVGFLAGQQLRRVSIEGGQPVRIAETKGQLFHGASWSPDGEMVVFSEGIQGRTYSVPARGGEPTELLDKVALSEQIQREVWYTGRSHFPLGDAGDGQMLLKVVARESPSEDLGLYHLSSRRLRVFEGGDFVAHSPSGHLVYRAGLNLYELWALPVENRSLEPSGESFLVAQEASDPSVARDGTLCYLTAASREQRLVWLDRKGDVVETTTIKDQSIHNPTVSPDSRYIVVGLQEETQAAVWVYDVAQETRLRRLYTSNRVQGAAWAESSDELAFSDGETMKIGPIEAGLPRETVASGWELQDWSADGRYLVYQTGSAETEWDIAYRQFEPSTGEWTEKEFAATAVDEELAKLSPDGTHLAYVTNDTGVSEVYVQPFPRGGPKHKISSNGGTLPRWSRDGRQLFYVEDDTLIVVPIQTRPAFEKGSPQRLFAHPSLVREKRRLWPYDVSADGQRFLIVEDIPNHSGTTAPAIRIVQNWWEEFRDRQ